MWKSTLSVLRVVVPAAMAGSIAAGGAWAGPVMDRMQAEHRITVAVANEPPYGYRTADGAITGEAPEIARHVLREIDPEVRIDWVVTEFGDLIPGLHRRAFDMAAAGMFITPDRCRQVAFTDPTYVIGEAFVVRAGNPRRLTDYWSVADDRGARLGLMAGAVEYNYALVVGIPAHRLVMYPTLEAAAEGLRAEEIDAIGATSLSATALVREFPDLETTAQFYPEVDGEITRGFGAFAFHLDDRDLAQAFDKVLAEFIGSPEHLELVASFGFGEDMLPDRSREELCGGAGASS